MTFTPPLISSELAFLWKMYQSETLSRCVMQHFHATVEDPQTKELTQRILTKQDEHIRTIRDTFVQEQIPVPVGFGDKDVHPHAPKLYNDGFILQFAAFMNRLGMDESSMAVSVAANSDLRRFFISRLKTYTEFEDASFQLLLEKGMFVRAPLLPYPKETRFVAEKGFLDNLLGGQKTLTALEVHHLFINLLRNQLGMMLLISFIQTAPSDESRSFFEKGKDLADEFAQTFNAFLRGSDLPPVALQSVGITDSTRAPFSEKLMLNLVTAMNSYGIGVYGISLSETTRPDLAIEFTRIVTATGKYAKDGLSLMIEHGYLEEPPKSPER